MGLLKLDKRPEVAGTYPDLLSADQYGELAGLCRLTHQEEHVLRLVCRGLCNKAIGRSLHMAQPTVRTHLRHLYAKLECTDRVDLILFLVQGYLKTRETHP